MCLCKYIYIMAKSQLHCTIARMQCVFVKVSVFCAWTIIYINNMFESTVLRPAKCNKTDGVFNLLTNLRSDIFDLWLNLAPIQTILLHNTETHEDVCWTLFGLLMLRIWNECISYRMSTVSLVSLSVHISLRLCHRFALPFCLWFR